MSTFGGFGNGIKNPFKFDVSRDMPNLSSKVIIVTGGNAGVGKECVLRLAERHPRRLYLSARSQSKFDTALKDIQSKVPGAKVEFLELDLASLPSVKRAAEKIIAENDRVDVLMNNAGIMGAPHGFTADGYEAHFGTNHMGHALLTKLLLPLMERTAAQPGSDVRLVAVSSTGHSMAPSKGVDFEVVKTAGGDVHPFTLYGISKLANILHAREVAKQYPQILAVSIHPGRVGTALLDQYMETGTLMVKVQKLYDFIFGTMTPETGALNQLWAVAGKRQDIENGAYYTPIGYKGRVSSKAKDDKLADKLWRWQEDEFRRLGY